MILVYEKSITTSIFNCKKIMLWIGKYTEMKKWNEKDTTKPNE